MICSIHCPVLGNLTEEQEKDCRHYGCIGSSCKHPSLNRLMNLATEVDKVVTELDHYRDIANTEAAQAAFFRAKSLILELYSQYLAAKEKSEPAALSSDSKDLLERTLLEESRREIDERSESGALHLNEPREATRREEYEDPFLDMNNAIREIEFLGYKVNLAIYKKNANPPQSK